MVRGVGFGRDVLVDCARDSPCRATHDGQRTGYSRRMVAHRRAIGCGDWSFDGLHLLRIRGEKSVVAARCARDVWAHRCLRDEPWRTEYESSRDDEACYYQRYFVWRRLSLVFLF